MNKVLALKRRMHSIPVIAFAGIALSLAVASSDASAQTGRIVGTVVEEVTGIALPGANVVIRGRTYGAATDAKGQFVIPAVPRGTYVIEVSYIGYQKMEVRDVTVEAGRSTTLSIKLSPVTVQADEVVVWGMLAKGQARALNQQMSASNIKSIVASDQMGRFPDASAPEAVQRIPGVSISRDQGEGRYIQIRGGSSKMTSVSFNGDQIPQTERETRQQELDMVPVGILESIEVSKALTPDMDADAIGGAVNLVTRKAPPGLEINVEGSSNYATIRNKYGGSGSISAGSRFIDGALGVVVSGSWSRRDFGSDGLEPRWTLNAPGLADDRLSELDVRSYSLYRIRQGGTGMIDYRLSENSTLYIAGTYAESLDKENRLRIRHAVASGRMDYQHRARREEDRVYNLSAGGDHELSSGTKLDYRVVYAESREKRAPIELFFRRSSVSFTPNISDPNNIQANPTGGVDGTYNFRQFQPASSFAEGKDVVANFNVAIPFRLGAEMTGALKFGGKYRSRQKNRDDKRDVWILNTGVPNIVLGTHLGVPFSNEGFNPGVYPFPSKVTAEGDVLNFLKNYRASLRGNFTYAGVRSEYERALDVNDSKIKESVGAAFAMAEIDISPDFMILPGVRFEQTWTTADGFTWHAPTATLSPSNKENSYGYLFPMIHGRYRLSAWTNLRAAVTTALARPDYMDLVPYRNDDGTNISIGNPDLRPTRALNADLLLEHFDEYIGVMSAGLFYKNLSDPIFPFGEPNAQRGVTTQSRNTTSGTIYGVELAIQRQLKFLPAPFDGFGVYANYTYTTSKASLPHGERTRLAGQADHVFNAAVSFEKWGFSGQLSANYNGDFVDSYGTRRDEDVYQDSHLQFDASVSAQLMQQLILFAEVVNITNEPFRTFQADRSRPYGREFYETWGRVGLRLKI
ncbi:MAG: TonB-dependent receptor [Ignavibacteria bacterium]|nr:TonB-dependent receptor [Ignavibacteria bacterium]